MASTVNNLLTEGANEHGQSRTSTWGSISGTWKVTLTEGHILLTNLIMSECVLSVKSSGASSTCGENKQREL